MAEFIEVMRQARKMCKAHECCESCPIWDTAKLFCRIGAACESDYGVTESVVMAWAAEHPEPAYPTWKEWHGATFPRAIYRHICPATFGDEYTDCGKDACGMCVERTIPAEIAEKLGIKPKEVK